ncbi:MAG TPA: hypothetical protein VKS79_25485 [Gemmataceae bacterium]|nr:hypothetical protein [Gemmataceae bacterium]
MTKQRCLRWFLAFAAIVVLVGCDGKDPDRLNRVGKKMVEKGRKFSEESKLPKVTVELPEDASTEKKQ